jgi:hypothetical protein
MTQQQLKPGRLGLLTGMLLSILLSSAGCAEARRAHGAVVAHSDAGEPAGAAASSRPHAQDAGAACRGGGSLSDYCAHETCPAELSVAPAALCGEANDAPHEMAENACSGMSAVHHGADGDTRYDFGAQGELLGVTFLAGKRTCGGSEATYGEACSVTGEPEKLCGHRCGFIACAAGLSISVDAATPKDYQSATVKLCRNDLCSSGTFNEKIEAVSGSKEIAYYETLSDRSAVTVMFAMDRPTPWLFIYFEAPAQNLQHGDHYSIEVMHPDGHELYKFDQTIERYDSPKPNPPCTLYCKVKDIDSRTPLPDSSDAQ